MDYQAQLAQKLEDISKVFKIDDVIKTNIDEKYIQKYYWINKIPYSLFHTKKDFVHMGISRDGVYKESDLWEAPKIVEGYLKRKLKGNKVLELATGRGANSFYLAKKFPMVSFYGIDIAGVGQLECAFKKAKVVNNFYPDFGDYHDLSGFKNETFDIIFVIEALCHSTNKNRVLAEVYRILKKDGIFIIIDGYLNKKRERLSSDEKIAAQLTEKGMAVAEFEFYDDFIVKIKANNLEIEFEENVSQFVIPTMNRFEKKSALFFKHTKLAKLALRIFPKEFLYNAIAGYLSSLLMKTGVCNYMITVLKKKE